MSSGYVDHGNATDTFPGRSHETNLVDCQGYRSMNCTCGKTMTCFSLSCSGLFSLAKQKIKSVQDNFNTNPNDSINTYAQYFVSDSVTSAAPSADGYTRSHHDKFNKIRKEKLDQISIETTRLLLRLVQLTSIDEHVPKNANTKERRSESDGETSDTVESTT